MTFRLKKVGYTTAAGLGLFVGAAGIAAASTGAGSDPSPEPPAVVAPSADIEDDVDDGVNCENGIDTATGAECDGGPAAAEADEATEAPDNQDAESDEADDGVDYQFEGEEVGENGDGIPDADDATETESDG